jgi:hypothetical protein
VVGKFLNRENNGGKRRKRAREEKERGERGEIYWNERKIILYVIELLENILYKSAPFHAGNLTNTYCS